MIAKTFAQMMIKNPMLSKQLFMAPTYAIAKSKFSDRLHKMRSKSINAGMIPEESTLKSVINDVGKNEFLQRVYKTTGLSIAGALAISQFVISSGLVHNNLVTFGGLFATLGGIIGSSYMSPKIISVKKNGVDILKSENSTARLALFGTGIAGLGMTASPLFYYANQINPAILPVSIFMSSMVFGGASYYALMKPKDSLLSWQRFLVPGLFGLIGAQFTGLISQMIFGPNMFSMAVHRADTYLGLGLFTALVAYDTHVALKAYEEGYADHIGVSIDFVLDFWNILTRMVQIMSMFSRD